MPAYYRLQDLTTVSANGAQRLEEAIDVGGYRTLIAQCRKPVAASAGTLKLQHAAVPEEAAFVDVSSPTFNLASAGNDVQVFNDLLRYVRWSVSGLTGTSQFLVDIVAREG